MSATGPLPDQAFDHSDPGTPERRWLDEVRWTDVPRPAWLPGATDRLVLVAAHPDDECLGAGGLAAAAHDTGLEVEVLVATSGEGSHPGSPTTSPTAMARRRIGEVQAAVAEVAPSAVLTCLGLPDGGLADHVDDLRRAVAARLGPDPAHTLVAGPWVGDRHPDHEAAGTAVLAACREHGAVALGYPVWFWHWGEPTSPELDWSLVVRLDLTGGQRDAKRRALDAYRSQTEPLSDHPADAPVVSTAMRSHSQRDFETFVLDDPAQRAAVELEALHRRGEDPWNTGTSWYEQRKRSVVLASLPRARFSSALEVGCSVGVLTASLAQRCEQVLGLDLSETALAAARARLWEVPGVDLLQARVPAQWPEGSFDLVVLSEVGYFLAASELDDVADRALASLRPDGLVVACHWRHPVVGWPLDGDEVHHRLTDRLGLALLVSHVEEDFVVAVLGDGGASSPARAEGLLGSARTR